MMKRIRKVLLWTGVALLALAAALTVALVIVHEPRPIGREGSEADDLARQMEDAVDLEAWSRTKAIRWTFAGRNRHLWDRQRNLARVSWDDTVVLLRLGDRSGLVFRRGQEVDGREAREACERAYAAWINDSFWLNPISMFRGEGVSRAAVPLDGGQRGLLVSYSTGGLTPGDAYLWLLGEEGLPSAWRMWVSIIPIGGLEASWTGWQTLSTGARVSTRHVGPMGLALELTDVSGAETLQALSGEEDPFALLVSVD